jgi:dolichol-phosphate mannosyltransferase
MQRQRQRRALRRRPYRRQRPAGGTPLGSAAVRTLVVLPTYNEADNIREVLLGIRAALPGADILVVDDSSPDGTGDLADVAAKELGSIQVLRRPAKSGLGTAYREGFKRGRSRGYEVLVEMDSDLSHDPCALPGLVGAVADGADLAIGSRYVPGGSMPNWSWHRQALSRYGNRYASRLLGLAVRDATSGFRAYRGELFDRIQVDTVRADGYGFQIEMAYRVARAGGRVVELPIEFIERERGCSKMSSRIVMEALALVTWWGVRDRARRALRRR